MNSRKRSTTIRAPCHRRRLTWVGRQIVEEQKEEYPDRNAIVAEEPELAARIETLFQKKTDGRVADAAGCGDTDEQAEQVKCCCFTSEIADAQLQCDHA